MAFNAESAYERARSSQQEKQDKFDASAAYRKARGEAREALPTDELGADFDTENTAPYMLRFDLSRGDNLEEKRIRLRDRYPEGDVDIIQDPGYGQGRGMFKDAGEPILVYRESEQAQWKRVDPEGGIFGGDMTGDVVEAFGPSAESIVGETAMAIASRGTSVLATIGRQVLGAMGGEAVEQGVQYLTGRQAQSPTEVAVETITEGVASAIGGLAASPIVAGKNILSGAGALRVGEQGSEALRAANRIDPELGADFTPGMVSDNPIVQLSEKQAAALLPGLPRRYHKLIHQLDDSVRRMFAGKNADSAMSGVVSSMKRMRGQLIAGLSTGQSKSKGGRALQESIANVRGLMKTGVDGLYTKARSIEEPILNMGGIEAVENDLRAGIRGKISPEIIKQLNELKAIQGPIELSDGTMLSVTDQIRNVRTELNSLADVPDGAMPNNLTGQASILRNVVNQILKNPENTNPAFLKAWAEADAGYSVYRDTMGKIAVVTAAKSQNPADLVKRYAKPDQVDNLLALRNASDPVGWHKFTTSWQKSLLDNPKDITKTLNKFDQETLDVLLPRKDQELWRGIGMEMDRITAVGAEQLAEIQMTNKNFMATLIRKAKNNPRIAHTVSRAVAGDEAKTQSLRGSILEWAWDGVVTPEKNTLKVSSSQLARNVDALKQSGFWELLTPAERKQVADVETVSRVFHSFVDAGTSIRAAEVSAGLKELKASSISALIREGLISHFYLSDAGRRILLGSGKEHSPGQYIRAFGGALTQMSRPVDISTLDTDEE